MVPFFRPYPLSRQRGVACFSTTPHTWCSHTLPKGFPFAPLGLLFADLSERSGDFVILKLLLDCPVRPCQKVAAAFGHIAIGHRFDWKKATAFQGGAEHALYDAKFGAIVVSVRLGIPCVLLRSAATGGMTTS